jgi:hypothetical protein
MAQAATFGLLSASANGKQIKIVATSTPGTTIHTAVAGTSSWDRIFLYAVNSSANPVKLTLEWGEATAPDGNIEQTIQPESGLVPLTYGIPLQNSLVVKAFADTTNVVMIGGYVLTVA